MEASAQHRLLTEDNAVASLGEALGAASRALAAAGVDAPVREARRLAAHALGIEVTMLTAMDTALGGQARAALDKLVARRVAREPLAYITGRRGFWTLDLATGPQTLIPRPDSETLIEAALAALPDRGRVRHILDLGTGTGCLLLSALSEFLQAFGVGIDVAPEAASLAAGNARACGLAGRARFVAGDWAACLDARFDLVLCNPPYIASAALDGLMPEVRLHEPRRALDGGASGLACYARLLPAMPRLLRPAGIAVLELGAGQLAPVADLARAAGLTHIASRADLGGIPRALVVGLGTPDEAAGTKAAGTKAFGKKAFGTERAGG